MIYISGAPADYDHWAYLGDRARTAQRDALLQEIGGLFRRRVDYHSIGGPLAVSHIVHPNPLTEAFIDAALHGGHAINYDFSGPDLIGVG